MKTKDQVRTAVRGYIAEHLARDHRDVDLDKESLVETGVIDSLGIMKLVEFVERTLGAKITDDDILPENFDTLETIAALVVSKMR